MRDKAFNIVKNPKYDGCQRGIASMVYKFLIIRKFKKAKVQSLFIDNIWVVDFGDMQLISLFNKEMPLGYSFKR